MKSVSIHTSLNTFASISSDCDLLRFRVWEEFEVRTGVCWFALKERTAIEDWPNRRRDIGPNGSLSQGTLADGEKSGAFTFTVGREGSFA